MPAQGFSSIDDAAWWTPGADLSPAVDSLLDQDFIGLALDAPARVDPVQQSALPLAVVSIATYRQARDWTFREHVLVAATDVDRNETFLDLAEVVGRPVLAPPPRDVAEAEEDSLDGKVIDSRLLDVRRRLALPWRPARLILTLLSRGQVSNRVAVVLGDVPGGAPQPSTYDVTLKDDTLHGPAGEPGEPAEKVTCVVTGRRVALPFIRVFVSEPGRPLAVPLASLRAPSAPPDDYFLYVFAGSALGGPLQLP